MLSIRTLFLAVILSGLSLLTSCACIASSGCSGQGSQSQLDARVNWNAALTAQDKIHACKQYTESQTFYGSTCTISWK